MAVDIYNRAQANVRGSLAADGAQIIFSSGGTGRPGLVGGVGLIVQAMNLGYQQQVSLFFALGSSDCFVIAGRPRGQLGLNRVFGPAPVQVELYSTYGDACNIANNNLTLALSAGCSGGGEFRGVPDSGFDAGIQGFVIQGFGLQGASEDNVIREQLSGMFLSLDLKSRGAAAA